MINVVSFQFILSLPDSPFHRHQDELLPLSTDTYPAKPLKLRAEHDG